MPVVLSLDGVRNDGEDGELDDIGSDVENLEGGEGNDSLTGNTAGNYLAGGAGNDVLDVGPADAAYDSLSGGEGDDIIRTRDAGAFPFLGDGAFPSWSNSSASASTSADGRSGCACH